MGKLLGGGSKSKTTSTSGNYAYDQLNSTFTPLTQAAGTGMDAFQQLMSGDSSGFDAYKQATGFDAQAEYGSRGITNNAAAGGLLRSGSTAKALQAYGTMLQNQYANSYLDKLLAQIGLGVQAGGVISGAGQYGQSQSKSSSKGGLGGFAGGLMGGIAKSERKVKKNIFRVGSFENGLPKYQFRYLDGSGPFIGAMVEDVRELAPEALGPVVDGIQTVNYDILGD